MRLNHINLCASDVEALADTLVQHFGYRTADSGNVPGASAADQRFAAVEARGVGRLSVRHRVDLGDDDL